MTDHGNPTTVAAGAGRGSVDAPSERILYMVGNAHIDPVWLWQWQEGLQEVRATFSSALERMDEYDDFVFTADSVAYLEWVERVDPELFARIAGRVKQGRFVVVGGWWIEPDCNLPHGESFVRQALYAQRFLRDRFGAVATVGCNVDPFGHAATLPQLLSKAGLETYIFLRPQPKEKTLPGEVFWWVAADGSRVLAYRIPYAYCSPGEDLGTFLEHVIRQSPLRPSELMVFYGVGNHGGGPTRANLDSIKRLNAANNGLELRLSAPGDYFVAVAAREDIPTYVGDLQHHAVGCYSAHSGVKRWNRRAEHLLMSAERWSAVAAALGGPAYPAQALTEAWKLVLFNQFHDTLAGTAISPAYDDARDQIGHASSIAADAMNLAAQSVSRRIAISPEEGTLPVVVFNPVTWPVRADVEFEVEAAATVEAKGSAGYELAAFEEESGAEVAVQRIRSRAVLDGPHQRLVLSTELPALGYRTYRLRPRTGGKSPYVDDAATGTVLENEHLRVELDPGTGWISSFFDKDLGAELARREQQSHAVVIEDLSDTWGHDVVEYDEEVGRFCCTSAEVFESGPVRVVVQVESTFGRSHLRELFILGRRSRHLEVRVTVDWHEQLRLLKLRFPSALQAASAVFSVPYGRLERPNSGSEEVAQAWVDVSGTLPGGMRGGWALLNDGKYGFDVRGADIGMTVVRSPVYAWHHPRLLAPGETYEYMDQGRQEFSYALVAHQGEPGAEVPRLAEELNERPLAFREHFHPGSLPLAQSFADDGGGTVLVSVVKQAEEGSGTILRAYEAAGSPAAVRLALPLLGRTIESTFAAGEVKTFFVPLERDLPVEEVSLLEWPEGPGQVP
ncbi:MAG: glycoside hydrolase family 38 C-terminal domain-containing protein [Acidimicrobiales bacterium]|jgi:alpha-mannosidase